MAQIGLADTLKLLAAGYKKKDIEALASIDSAKDPDPKDPDPDYKALLEEKQKELDEIQKKLEKLQKENTQKDSAPAAAEAKQKEAESLTDLVRGFM